MTLVLPSDGFKNIKGAIARGVLFMAFVCAIAAGARAETSVTPSGSGTSGSPYQITELGNLVWLDTQAEAGNTSGKYYELINDIDASATATWNDNGDGTYAGFDPIGDGTSAGYFKGYFEGGDYTISGLTINRNDESYVGFFAVVSGGTVDNLNFSGGSVAGYHYTGFVAGMASGSAVVTNCSASGSVYGVYEETGGLLGRLSGADIGQCSFTGGVTGDDDLTGGIVGYVYAYSEMTFCDCTGSVEGYTRVGGLAGCVGYSDISDSYFSGSLESSSGYIGGLAGQHDYESTIDRCYATGDIDGGGHYVGGLVGYCRNRAEIANSYSTASVTGGSRTGGVVGWVYNECAISYCYATGGVTGDNYVGGFAGASYYKSPTISYCHSSGDVEGVNYVGGFIGQHGKANTVEYCHASGDVTGTQYVGGLFGEGGVSAVAKQCYAVGSVAGVSDVGGLGGYESGTVTYTGCFWNEDTTGQSTSTGGSPLSNAEMLDSANFMNWDFTTTPVWGISGGYPYIDALDTCVLTFEAGANGDVSDGVLGSSPIAQTVNKGAASSPIEAVADANYHFVGWSDATTDSPYAAKGILSDTTLTASFSNLCTLTYVAGEHGLVDGATSVTQTVTLGGDGAAVTATAIDSGYYFAYWSDGVADNPRTDLTLQNNIDVTAIFHTLQEGIQPVDGDGLTTATAYQISELTHLAWMGEQVAEGNSTGVYYKLMNDIDAVDASTWDDGDGGVIECFDPIGDSTHPFAGFFLGQGYSIQNLKILRNSAAYVGLFGYASSARIQGVNLEDSYAAGADYSGLLAGYAHDCVIADCRAAGELWGGNYSGGLVGYAYGGTISGCEASVELTGMESCGGLLGVAAECVVATSSADVDLDGNGSLGGLIGMSSSYAAVDGCSASGTIYNEDGGYIGGLIGYNPAYSSITCSFATTDVETTGTSVFVGGLVGYHSTFSEIDRCYATGDVSGYQNVGALAGFLHLSSPVTDSYATGNVVGEEAVGGCVGFDFGGSLDNCYFAGQVTGTSNVDAIAGISVGSITDCFWDATVSGINASDFGTSLTTQLMKIKAPFVGAGWPFADCWGSYNAYPYLADLPWYRLSYTAGDGGSIIAGDFLQIVNEGNDGWGVAVEAAEHYTFSQWSDGVTDNPRVDLDVTDDVIVEAEFTIDQYTLTYTAGSAAMGYIAGDTPQSVDYGDSGTTVTATPWTAYHFVQWSDGSTDNPRTDTNVTADITVEAQFALNEYTLSYTAGDGGSLSGDTSQTVEHGGFGTVVTAAPYAGYYFLQWSDGSTDNPRTDTNVTADITVEAQFVLNEYTLSYTAGDGGSLSGDTSQTVEHGGFGTVVTAAPDAGYYFLQWSDGSTDNPRTDENITGDITVEAQFALNEYTLSYTAGDGGSLSGDTSQTVEHGGSGTVVTATPDAGYYFLQWSDGSTDNPRTDEDITGDITVEAQFAANITAVGKWELYR